MLVMISETGLNFIKTTLDETRQPLTVANKANIPTKYMAAMEFMTASEFAEPSSLRW
jgi:hypothetical protein